MDTIPTPGRQQRSEAEIKEILREFEENNLTVRDFCELFAISEPTFYNWRRKYLPKAEKGEDFIPLQLPEQSVHIFAEIEVPGKVVFRFFRPMDASFFKALMQ